MDKEVVDFLKVCFSCPMGEGYGLTETAAHGCRTKLEETVLGHVGGPGDMVKMRLKDLPDMSYLSSDKPYPRGEICFKGPGIFKGYYKRPDKTSEAFDEEDWFLTGDVGMVFPNGCVKIIDRSKNIFKLSQGEYIAPQKIEGIYSTCDHVSQIMVCGDSLKSCVVAIVTPEETIVASWAEKTGKDKEEAYIDPDFKAEVMAEMAAIGTKFKLSGLEKPKEIYLTNEPFTVENGLLTSTMKLKRN